MSVVALTSAPFGPACVSKIPEFCTLGKRCFLEGEEWRSTPDDLINSPLLPTFTELYHYPRLFVNVPGFLKEVKLVVDYSPNSDRETILTNAEILRQDLKHGYHEYTSREAVQFSSTVVTPMTRSEIARSNPPQSTQMCHRPA